MSKKEQKTLKTKIKVYRAMHRDDLTQEDLAKKVGVRRETISYIERGKYSPSLRLAYDIALALETTMDELFTYE